MSEELNQNPFNNDRRRFMRNAAMALAAAELVTISSAVAQPSKKNAKDMTPATPASKGSSGAAFGPLKQIDAGLLNIGYAEAGPAEWSCSTSTARLALRHLQLCRCRAFVGFGRLQGNRPLSARLRYDALSLQRNDAECPAVGRRPRHHRSDGCAQDPDSYRRRL